jgi:hypothetical protein
MHFNVAKGQIEYVGSLEADLVLTSIKVGKTTLRNLKFPNAAFLDVLENYDQVVIGYKRKTVSQFWAFFWEHIAQSNESSYKTLRRHEKTGTNLGKSEECKVFYVRGLGTDDEVYLSRDLPAPEIIDKHKFLTIILFLLLFSLLMQIIGIFAFLTPLIYVYIIRYTPWGRRNTDFVLGELRKDS